MQDQSAAFWCIWLSGEVGEGAGQSGAVRVTQLQSVLKNEFGPTYLKFSSSSGFAGRAAGKHATALVRGAWRNPAFANSARPAFRAPEAPAKTPTPGPPRGVVSGRARVANHRSWGQPNTRIKRGDVIKTPSSYQVAARGSLSASSGLGLAGHFCFAGKIGEN